MGQPSGNPVAPPRTRRSSSHNSLLSSDSHCDIQAANAISGGVQANQDLPYMTPPLLMLLPHPPQPQHNSPQQHFSGDSQDSSNCFISCGFSLAFIVSRVNCIIAYTEPVIIEFLFAFFYLKNKIDSEKVNNYHIWSTWINCCQKNLFDLLTWGFLYFCIVIDFCSGSPY